MLTPVIIVVLLTLPLFLGFIVAKINRSKLDVRKLACWGLGIAFIYFFVGHFAQTEGMVAMLPEWVPMRQQLVYATGLLELAIGVALFIPGYQSTAARLAIFVFVAFFPANIYAALNGVGLGGHQWGPVYLWIRGPLQIILIAWAYFLCVQKAVAPMHRTHSTVAD